MKIMRLRNKLLLSVTIITIVMALTSMLAVSWVIGQQYLNQSNALLSKAFRVIDDNLAERQRNQLDATRQLASQKNLGSTIWYLSKYTQSNVDGEMLLITYQQLAKDTYKLGRVAQLSKVAIYDQTGHLISFAQLNEDSNLVGFVKHMPAPLFQVAALKEGEELNRNNMHTSSAVADLADQFDGSIPQQESVHYAVINGKLVLESYVPIMGKTLNPNTRKQQTRQLGLVVTVRPLDQKFVDHLARLTDLKINIFTAQHFSSGNLPTYRHPDLRHLQHTDGRPLASENSFNETTIGGESFYQILIPVYTGQHLIGTIAALHSKAVVQKNIREMIQTLALITIASLLLIFPFAWYFSTSIARPLTVLSRIFRGVASGSQLTTLNDELNKLRKEKARNDELGDLTQSFIAMNDSVHQKIQQIHEINASLEEKIAQRTQELRLANGELTKLVTHDTLTGLPNRKLLGDRLQRALFSAKRDQLRMALMFIDLDQFKPINDMHGHAIGDLLLKEVSERIQNCLRESDTVSRIGGDEFIILLPIIETEQDALGVAEKIRHALNQHFHVSGKNLTISSSIGIAIYPEHGIEESMLLKNADAAMYCAKESGRNAVRLFQTLS